MAVFTPVLITIVLVIFVILFLWFFPKVFRAIRRLFMAIAAFFRGESFAEVARRLVVQLGCQVVFTGTEPERGMIEGIRAGAGVPSANRITLLSGPRANDGHRELAQAAVSLPRLHGDARGSGGQRVVNASMISDGTCPCCRAGRVTSRREVCSRTKAAGWRLYRSAASKAATS